MADEKILKPKSFRIDDDTAERFRQISEQIGSNQQQTLAKLIEAYEFQAGKAVLTDKKADIEQFERYTGALIRMYMGSLEDLQNLENTIRSEFSSLLNSKDMIIQRLQNDIKNAKDSENTAIEQVQLQDKEIDTLRKQLAKAAKEAMDMEARIADKDTVNNTLAARCQDLESRLIELEKLEKLKKEQEGLLSEIKKLKDNNNAIQLAATHDQEQLKMQYEKQLFEQQKQHQEQLADQKQKQHDEISKYQQKYFELLERLGQAE